MMISTPPLPLGGAEALVRVNPVTFAPQRAQLIVDSGPWLRDDAAGCSRGALGVPLDDVTGYLVALSAPAGKWPVSLGIRIDFLADPLLDGPPMTATGELVGRDERGGTTRGTVTDDRGRVLALVVQRSHLVPVAETPTGTRIPDLVPADDVPLRSALGIRTPAPGVLELPSTVFAANAMGNVHGGILIAGAEFAAMTVLGATGEQRATSIDISYIRPADAAGMTTFRSRVLHQGRSLAVVQVCVVNSSNKPCALATVVVQR
ncbi:thioesterase [Nocardia farcinica]|uniref:hotdog fold thioesterase n=1 Tax=Nocardia farcinica TaxID=37329 RepID=UPI000A3CDD9F|nr:hotdog fold thioesterase [Nocardia farcinica]SUE28884.1 thioesterase [Nocardia farcinica]